MACFGWCGDGGSSCELREMWRGGIFFWRVPLSLRYRQQMLDSWQVSSGTLSVVQFSTNIACIYDMMMARKDLMDMLVLLRLNP